MAPAVLQAIWSMSLRDSATPTPDDSASAHQARLQGNVNTCHVWDENGAHVKLVRSGGPVETMIPVAVRLRELGRSDDEWRQRFMPYDD